MASRSSASGCTALMTGGGWSPAMSTLARRSPTSWISRMTWRCRRRAVFSSNGRTPSCTASISARIAASGVRSSCAVSPIHWRREASTLASCSAMALKVWIRRVNSSLSACSGTRVCSSPAAMACAPVTSVSMGRSQRRASHQDSSSASARPVTPLHTTKPSCLDRKARSASRSSPSSGASTRWPIRRPSPSRSAVRAPPATGAAPATTRPCVSTTPRRRESASTGGGAVPGVTWGSNRGSGAGTGAGPKVGIWTLRGRRSSRHRPGCSRSVCQPPCCSYAACRRNTSQSMRANSTSAT